MSRALSTPQRIGIRAIADGRPADVPSSTFWSLVNRELVIPADGVTMRKAQLTAAGRRAHEQIMASGDGPEDLKARFAFLGARR